MATLNIPKAYAAGSPLMESHIDYFRDGLLALFNTDKLSSINFSQGMELTSAKFSSNQILTSNNSYIMFGSDSDCKMGMDGSGNLVFDTTATSTEIKLYAGDTYYLEVAYDRVNLKGTILHAGGVNQGIKGLLGKRYVKPSLEWQSTTSISISSNSYSTNVSMLIFPKFIASVDEDIAVTTKYRIASISNTANGYGTGDAGAAQGGRRSGLALTTNSWYYVYAAKLRSGTDYSATTAKFVLVFDDTSPTPANESTLNTRYGTGNWIYMGLVRYGYGATGATNEIIKFKYSNKGRCFLYGKSSAYAGLHLAYSTTDADNDVTPLYTTVSGTSGNVIPSIIGQCMYGMVRALVSDWYIRDTADNIIWRGGWQTDVSTIAHGHVVELPYVAGHDFMQLRKGSLAGAARAVVLLGFVDGYVVQRNQGKGI